MVKKAKSKSFRAEVDDDDDDDDNEWVEEKAPEEKKEPEPEKVEHQHEKMPENRPGKAPPDPKDQPAVGVNYDLFVNMPAAPAKEK